MKSTVTEVLVHDLVRGPHGRVYVDNGPQGQAQARPRRSSVNRKPIEGQSAEAQAFTPQSTMQRQLTVGDSSGGENPVTKEHMPRKELSKDFPGAQSPTLQSTIERQPLLRDPSEAESLGQAPGVKRKELRTNLPVAQSPIQQSNMENLARVGDSSGAESIGKPSGVKRKELNTPSSAAANGPLWSLGDSSAIALVHPDLQNRHPPSRTT
jgi:hypothetical protein